MDREAGQQLFKLQKNPRSFRPGKVLSIQPLSTDMPTVLSSGLMWFVRRNMSLSVGLVLGRAEPYKEESPDTVGSSADVRSE